MSVIVSRAFARAGLLGNPSDGYYGKTIAVSLRNFSAGVRLWESDKLKIIEQPDARPVYSDMKDLHRRISLYGYYGGIRLIKAAIKRFFEYCRDSQLQPASKNFTLSYASDIPRQLGLGGSSAIITAVLRGLMRFYRVEIPEMILPTLILEAERDELGINAGFMDRVIQVWEGCVYMDLDRELIRSQGFGRYERLDPNLLPPLYLAYKPSQGKVSGKALSPIREGYDRGDPEVRDTLKRIAQIAEEGKNVILKQEFSLLFDLINKNFDLRSRIMPITGGNLEMIQTARACGASAKFTGSGGAVIGTYEGENMYSRLHQELGKLDALVIKPIIIS